METATVSTAGNDKSIVTVGTANGKTSIAPREESPGFHAASPFTFMRRFADDMERLVEDWGFGISRFSDLTSTSPEFFNATMFAFEPEIETLQKDDHFIVRVDLPGVEKDNVTVEIRDNTLMIRGFGYFGKHTAISQRVINESAEVADAINAYLAGK